MKTRNEICGYPVITARCGKIDPDSIEDYIAAGGYKALEKALNMTSQEVVDEVKASNLRGRGGAGFPTGVKMETILKTDVFPKYLVCNADEGEPGNFKDKYLMENDPHQLIEGMIITAYSMGIEKGYIYIRGEYNKPIIIMSRAIEAAREKGFLGKRILGSDFSFDIEIRSGAGAYICGEEFALIESIEGKAGRPRSKPPYPTVSGIYNKPTLINNVETFSNLPFIIQEGAEKFISIGTPSSSGTKLVSLSGNVNNRGVYEIPFGVTIRDIIYKLGGGIPENRKIRMVQLGGASGPCIPEEMLDIKLDYKEMENKGLTMGAGAVIVIDERYNVLEIVRLIMRFFRHESCGKCTPCREGNRQILRILYRFVSGNASNNDLALLESICNVMCQTSFCGLGQTAPTAVLTTMKYFRDDYLSGMRNLSTNSNIV
ncbi:MAG: NADH-quinone oxidoreductase subunit NuoF [Firmicutes bacterium]|nr:NADH-quinone oxidoreductase subunit NuoF [Bacillota bacterium]